MSDRGIAVLLFAGAFLLRAGAALVLPPERALLPDSYEYLAVADNIVAGRGAVLHEKAKAKRPPGYPAFLALFRRAFPGEVRPIQMAQAFLGGVSCVLVFLLGRRLLDRRAAVLGGATCGLYPLLVFTGPAILVEALLTALVLFEVWCLVRAEEGATWGWGAGLAGGLATLVHPGHALFFVSVLAYRRGRFLLPYLTILALAIGAWGWRNSRVLDRFVPLTTQSGYALYEAFGPEATGGTVGHRIRWPDRGTRDEAEYDFHLRREALRGWTPARFARLAIEKQRRFWSVVPHAEEVRSASAVAATLAFVPVLALAIVGLWRWPRGAGWILVPVGYAAALHLVFLGSIRYRLWIEPFLILIAAWGARRLIRSS